MRPGTVLTVEPGLYFHENALTVPPELRGIGVRIEDDVFVTDSGSDVLSAALRSTRPGWSAGWLRPRGRPPRPRPDLPRTCRNS
jgi:Xaa-Pro aminopeptidase